MAEQDEWQAWCAHRGARPGRQGWNKVNRAMARRSGQPAVFVHVVMWKPGFLELRGNNEAAEPVGQELGLVAGSPAVAVLSVEDEQDHLELAVGGTVGEHVEFGSRDVHQLPAPGVRYLTR